MSDIPHVGPTEEWPDRPDHSDFDILSALIILLTGEIDEAGKDFDLDEWVSHYVDPESLTYLAMHRVLRALEITSPEQVNEYAEPIFMLAQVYHEAFVVGCRYQQTKQRLVNSGGLA
jgi:hypothetical protein